jgi:hypothetical protein
MIFLHHQVQLQVAGQGERFVAYVTAVGLLPGVDHLVLLLVAGPGEGFFAEDACVMLLAGAPVCVASDH